MTEVTDLIDRQIEAYNRRDAEPFIACYAVDAHVYGPDGEVLAAGHDGLRAHYGPAFADQPDLRATITNRIAVGTVVVDHELVTGFVRDGQPVDINAVVVYRVVDGLIQDARQYR
jgi:putative hydrolase of HD superfamily